MRSEYTPSAPVTRKSPNRRADRVTSKTSPTPNTLPLLATERKPCAASARARDLLAGVVPVAENAHVHQPLYVGGDLREAAEQVILHRRIDRRRGRRVPEHRRKHPPRHGIQEDGAARVQRRRGVLRRSTSHLDKGRPSSVHGLIGDQREDQTGCQRIPPARLSNTFAPVMNSNGLTRHQVLGAHRVAWADLEDIQGADKQESHRCEDQQERLAVRSGLGRCSAAPSTGNQPGSRPGSQARTKMKMNPVSAHRVTSARAIRGSITCSNKRVEYPGYAVGDVGSRQKARPAPSAWQTIP